jgi:hypothetical protein
MSNTLYVKNLSLQATEDDLHKLFSLMGKVVRIHLVKDAQSGHFVGAGYVTMATEAAARSARIDLDGMDRAAHLLPAVVLAFAAPLVLDADARLFGLLTRFNNIYFILAGFWSSMRCSMPAWTSTAPARPAATAHPRPGAGGQTDRFPALLDPPWRNWPTAARCFSSPGWGR